MPHHATESIVFATETRSKLRLSSQMTNDKWRTKFCRFVRRLQFVIFHHLSFANLSLRSLRTWEKM